MCGRVCLLNDCTQKVVAQPMPQLPQRGHYNSTYFSLLKRKALPKARGFKTCILGRGLGNSDHSGGGAKQCCYPPILQLPTNFTATHQFYSLHQFHTSPLSQCWFKTCSLCLLHRCSTYAGAHARSPAAAAEAGVRAAADPAAASLVDWQCACPTATGEGPRGES